MNDVAMDGLCCNRKGWQRCYHAGKVRRIWPLESLDTVRLMLYERLIQTARLYIYIELRRSQKFENSDGVLRSIQTI